MIETSDYNVKDFHVINSEFGIYSWGSTHNINCQIFNIAKWKKFIVLVTDNLYCQLRNKISQNQQVLKDTYSYIDIIEFGGFYRVVYKFNSTIDNNKIDHIINDFHLNYKYNPEYEKIKILKEKLDFSFLSKLESKNNLFTSNENRINQFIYDVGVLLFCRIPDDFNFELFFEKNSLQPPYKYSQILMIIKSSKF
jgi:hypothetical protein